MHQNQVTDSMKYFSGQAFAILLCSAWLLPSCISPPAVKGFDKDLWKTALEECSLYRMEGAAILTDQFSSIKGASQNEIRALLGKEDRHELWERNRMFFFYDLQCAENVKGNQNHLRIRFDALGSAREMIVELKP